MNKLQTKKYGLAPTPECLWHQPVDEWSETLRALPQYHEHKSVVWGFTPVLKHRGSNSIKRGFTLLEVIIAIVVILIAVLAVVGLFRYIMVAGRLSAERFIASNLATEGIELIRSVRDSNWLQTASPLTWDNSLNAGGPGGSSYEIDYNYSYAYPMSPLNLRPWVGSGNYLKLDPSSGYYNYSTGENTKYTRKITIYAPGWAGCNLASDINPSGDECIQVVSKVTWTELGSEYSVTAEDWLYDWQWY